MDLFIAALALTAGQITRAVTGFGSALVAVPVLVMIWSPAEAVAVTTLLDLVSGLALLPAVRHRVIPSLLAVMLVAQFTGQVVGTSLLTSLEPGQLRLGLGVVLAPLALDILIKPIKAGRGQHHELPTPAGPVLAWGAFAGALGGTMSGAIGAGGPPIVIFARYYFTRETFRAQVLATFLVGAVPLLGLLFWRDLLGGVALQRATLLAPTVLLGAWVGHQLSSRLDPVTFGRVVGVVLLFAAGSLMLS